MMMTIADTAQQQGAPREGLIARHPLVFFFLLASAFYWGYVWLILVPLNLPGPLYALGAAGPTVSAFLVLALTSGKPGVLRLLRSMVHWRVGVQWYLVTLVGVPVLMLLSYLVVPGGLADFRPPDWSFLPHYLSEFAFTLFLAGGPLLEEGGWRGFALPRMQRRHGPVLGTVILGALWSLWHLPIFVGPLAATGPDATFVSVSIAFVEFTIGLIGFSIVTTWVLNNCRGSALMAILLHLAFDAAGAAFIVLFPSAPPHYIPVSWQTLGIAIVFSVAALVIIVATRGQLGYQRYQREVELPAVTGGSGGRVA
jgi:membrane protease YdiL (CAAX protease family)